MAKHDEVMQAIGQLQGQVGEMAKGQGRIEENQKGHDERLRAIEKKSAIWGAASGTIGALIVMTGAHLIKSKMGG